MTGAASTRTSGQTADILPRTGLILLMGLSAAWGLNWPMMKIVLAEVPVWNFRFISLGCGAIGLAVLAALTGQRLRPRADELAPLVACSAFNMIGWHMLSGYGVSLLEAGRAAIVAYTMPLWATLLSTWLLRERLGIRVLTGLALGLAGIGLLLAEDLGAFARSPLGTLIMMGAAFSWALGTVLTKRFSLSLPVLSFAAWQCGMAAPVILVGALVIEGLFPFGQMKLETWGALLYAVGICMIFCYWAWYSIVRLFPAAVASIGTLAIPVVGVLSSVTILGEPLGWAQVGALLLVGAGLVVVIVLPALRRPDSGGPEAMAR